MEKEEFSIIAKNISKSYKMYSSPKEKFLDLVLPKGAGKDFYALRDISFKVKKGDIVGLIGLNGSGKSTLSNILGGISMPTTGEIEIKGEAALIAIGLGLNNFLTGIENIEIKALMMGYKKSEIEEIKEEIIDFADIGDFINQPIRTYSSGMRSRLGFAISVHINPDILVIDEALSVGDPTFTQKCLDKIFEFKQKRKTVFFVSHSISQIKQFCNKVIWLEYGKLKEYGDVNEIVNKYEKYIKYINSMNKEEKKEYKKKVLLEQDHSLLKDFKVIDSKFKKVYPKGKLFKFVTLINKELNISIIPYNLDYYTLLFGFIPSILRKRLDVALGIFISQVIIFFIISFPFSIVVNFIFTTACSLFTGKRYIMYLIENKENIDFDIWKKHNESTYEIEYYEKYIEKDIRNKTIIRKIMIIVFLLGLSSLIIMYR